MGQMVPAQMGPTQQQMLAHRMAQNQMQQGFGMQQPPQPGQPLPNSMQQQPPQHQTMLQLGNGSDVQQPIHNGQPLRTMNRTMPQYSGQPQFTEQENQQITMHVTQMQKNLTNEDMANIQRQLNSLPAHQRQSMQAQGVNPLTAYLRSQVKRRFVEDRARRQQGGQGFAPPSAAAIANQGRPTSQVSMHSQGQQAPPASAPQHPEQSFAFSNMDQFLGQQQDALRHQEAGQMVVPMSNPQVVTPQVRGTPNPQGQAQFNPNRPMQPHNFQPQNQPFWNNQQTHQQIPQQPSQVQMQPPTPNFTGTQGQTPQLQGQVGGLSNNREQRIPQQNHVMPTLNKPLDPQGQAQNNQPQRPAQPTPKTNQRNAPGGPQAAAANAPPNSGPQRPQATPTPHSQWLAKMPQQIRAQLMSMPEDKQKQWMMQMQMHQKQRRMKAAADAQGANSDTALQSRQQGGAGAAQANQSKASNANLNTPQMPVNAITSVNMPSQGSQQQVPSDNARPAPSKLGAIQLNENQTRHMDSLNFPANLLNRSSDLGNLPENLRTWGQLKEHVHRNESNLPQSSLAKVISLQSIDFQLRQQRAMNQKRNQPQQQAQGNTGVAPVGQMMPPQHNQPAQGPAAPAPNPLRFPALPELTAQEIQARRATLPPQMKGCSDEQLRVLIMEQQRKKIMSNPQFQQAMVQQQQQQLQRSNLQRVQNAEAHQNHSATPPNQIGQVQQPQRGQPQPPQLGQARVPPQQQARQNVHPPKPAPGAWAGVQPDIPKPNQKGLKRINDDVIEVPDPKLNQQQGRLPSAKVSQPPPMVNGVPQITPEQFASFTNEQKAQFMGRMQAAQAAHRARAMQANGQTVQRQAAINPVNQGGRLNNRLHQLMNEVAQSAPRRPEVPMSPNTRKKMIEKLKEKMGVMVKRLDQSLPYYLGLSKDENRTKELLRIRLLLLQQVRDQHFAVPVDNFTMSLTELEQSEAKLHEYFQVMMNKHMGIPPAQNNQPQQLNAANLQQQEEAFKVQRAASVQKSHANNSNPIPAAPTTSHAPFPFDSQSSQGVSHFFNPKNELTSDKLVLPAPKRRKGNAASPATTPAETQMTPGTKPSPLPKTESSEVQRTPAAPTMIKCPISDCESGAVGFATKEDLEKHTSEAHDPTHAIKDPLDAAAYAIESLRIALNLDENGRSKSLIAHEAKGDNATLQAAAMKSTASSQGIKQETATPMSRVLTQTGPSPSSNLLKTPQAAANVKTPASEAKSVEKDTAVGGTNSIAVIAPDPWANSHVKPEWFKEVFSGVADLNRQVPMDIITSWFQRNPVSPPTSPSSGSAEKDISHKSDISANDDININLVATEDQDWVVADWFDDTLQGDMASLKIPDFMDMDWEHVFGKEDQEDAAGKGRRRDPNDPSDEWLKAWAPEMLEERKKEEAGRK